MTPVILILSGAIVGVGLILRLLHRPDKDKVPTDNATASGTPAETEAPADECCGQHAVCEKDSLLAGIDADIEYFDDEELDAFKGREADEYTDDEIEQFREVLLTLLPDDVAPWARSITRRGITLPSAVRDELLMLVDDIRRSRHNPESTTNIVKTS